jgi:aspartate/methionine/tyrosine aminotransferase
LKKKHETAIFSSPMSFRIIDLWERRDPLKEKNPRSWFTHLTNAFNDSPSTLRFGEDDNLDTGNASPEVEPFRPFVDSLLNSLLTESDPHRRYTQLNAHQQGKDALALSVRSAFTSLGIPNEPQTFACLAYGATQAWEACCRHILRRPGDVILVPTPTYTLLIPPVMLAQGEVECVDIGANGKLTPEMLSQVCEARGAELLQRWYRDLPLLFRLFASKAEVSLHLTPGTLSDVVPKSDDEIRALFSEAATAPVRVRDTMVGAAIAEHFSFTKEQNAALVRDSVMARYCLPPRIAGLLFLNPTLGGRYYTAAEVKALEPIVTQNQITVVEDLAYTLMPLEMETLKHVGRFGSLPECSRLSLTILGLSKPLSVANHRVSVVIAPRQDLVESVDSFVKASVAQVASYLYSAVTEALNTTDTLVRYVSNNATDSSFGYQRKLRLALGCLRGVGGDVRQKVEIVQAVAGSGGGVSPADPVIATLALKGLSEFMRVVTQPEGGIFLLVDAAGIIEVLRRAGIRGIESAYDLSIFLAFALKIRVIPEEAMNGWSHCKPGTLVRVTFSTTTSTFARAAMEMLKLFSEIAAMEPRSATRAEPIAAPVTEASVPPVEGRDLTPAEQSMFIEQMQRAKAYTVVSPTRIDGPLDLKTFQAAVDALVERHPSLRFSFPFRSSNGKPCCTTTAPPAPVIIMEREHIKAFVEQDFDVTDGATPLSAFRLFRIDDTTHLFLLVQHHIVTDNGSIGVLMSELFQLYGGEGDGTSTGLPPPAGDIMLSLPWSKHDDVLWHANRLASLEDPFPLAGDSISSVDMRMEIDAAQHQRINEAAKGRGTEFEVFMTITAMTLEAAMADATVSGAPKRFGVLLPASLRLSRDSLHATGFGVNSLVCRVDVDDELPFTALVDQTSDAVRSCREHISAPLPHVAKHLREQKTERVGEIAIAVRPPPSAPVVKTVNGAEISWSQVLLDEVRVDGTLHGTAKHPIGFVYSRKSAEPSSGFIVDIIVSSATPSGTAERLLAALKHIVSNMSPQLTSSDVDCSVTGEAFFSPSTKPALVPHQLYRLVARASMQRALWSPDSSLAVTSAEVAHRMLHVCSLVQSKKWKRVAVCLPAGPASIIAIMGVLAAGATCVLRRPNSIPNFSVDGILVAEGDEESGAAVATTLTPLRRDGTLPASVPAPSLPLRILDTLATIDGTDAALEYETDGAARVVITQAGLRRQCIAWGRVLQFATQSDDAAAQNDLHFRVASCDQAAEAPQYVIQSLVPILLDMQLIVSSDLRRIAGLSPPVNTVVLPRGEVLQSAVATTLSWSVAGRPIVLGPVLPEEESAAALFRKFPQLTSFPLVYAPRETGIAAIGVVNRDDHVERAASCFGAPCAGVHLSLEPLRGSTDDAVRSGKVGQVVVSSSWLKAQDAKGITITTSFATLSAGELVIASPHEASSADMANNTSTTQPTLRLTKLSATSSSSAVGSAEEEIVKDLFSEVLEIPKKTLTNSSDFFDMGGDSFTLSQLANRMQSHGAKFTVAVLINKILRDMTVHGVAQLLSRGANQVEVSHLDPTPPCAAMNNDNASSITAAGSSAQPLGGAVRSRSNSLIKSSASKTSLAEEGEVDWENEIYD